MLRKPPLKNDLITNDDNDDVPARKLFELTVKYFLVAIKINLSHLPQIKE